MRVDLLEERTQTLCWTFADGTQSGLQVGDEIRIDTGIPLIPFHMGIIYNLGDGTREQVKVIDCNKGVGVQVQSWSTFSGGRHVALSRRSKSPQHAAEIWKRGHELIGQISYDAVIANCEQFTDYCYTGQKGKSPTLGNFTAVALAVVAIVIADRF